MKVRPWAPLTLALAVGLLVLSTAGPALTVTAPSYPNTALVQSGMKQASIRGFSGVLVNYTNGFPASFTALVYLDLVNSEGQTAGVSLGTCGFQGNQTVSCFVTLPISVPTGNYTAWIFAASLANVPVSIESSIRVSA